jgi:hypothetical protein
MAVWERPGAVESIQMRDAVYLACMLSDFNY